MTILDRVIRLLQHGRYWADLPTAAQNGEVVEALYDPYGRQRLVAETPGGPVSYHDTVVPNAGGVIKNSPGALVEVWGFNDGAEAVYVQIHNRIAIPSVGQAPVLVFKVDAGRGFGFGLRNPRPFSTGMYWVTSSTPGTYTVVAGTVAFGAAYQ